MIYPPLLNITASARTVSFSSNPLQKKQLASVVGKFGRGVTGVCACSTSCGCASISSCPVVEQVNTLDLKSGAYEFKSHQW